MQKISKKVFFPTFHFSSAPKYFISNKNITYVRTAHSTQHTAHSTQHTAHTAHNTQHSTHSKNKNITYVRTAHITHSTRTRTQRHTHTHTHTHTHDFFKLKNYYFLWKKHLKVPSPSGSFQAGNTILFRLSMNQQIHLADTPHRYILVIIITYVILVRF